MAGVIDMTALRKQLEALEAAAVQAAQKASAPRPAAPPVQEGNLRSSRLMEDDNDEGVSTEGPQDKDRIASAPPVQRAQSKAVKKQSLFSDPKSIRRAIILSEILSPPLSKRR